MNTVKMLVVYLGLKVGEVVNSGSKTLCLLGGLQPIWRCFAPLSLLGSSRAHGGCELS